MRDRYYIRRRPNSQYSRTYTAFAAFLLADIAVLQNLRNTKDAPSRESGSVRAPATQASVSVARSIHRKHLASRCASRCSSSPAAPQHHHGRTRSQVRG
eukprot:4904159-Prymnesium_polylepis.1